MSGDGRGGRGGADRTHAQSTRSGRSACSGAGQLARPGQHSLGPVRRGQVRSGDERLSQIVKGQTISGQQTSGLVRLVSGQIRLGQVRVSLISMDEKACRHVEAEDLPSMTVVTVRCKLFNNVLSGRSLKL